MILGAIDIGSNAARLLIMEVVDTVKPVQFNKIELFRVPLRLGFDVFEKQYILPEKEQMFIETMTAFHHLMKAFKVDAYRAYATSAMRDAVNAKEIIQKIKKACGIEVEVITGDMEANLIYENHVAETMSKNHSYLYIDVGGGSTEVSFFENGKHIFKKSTNIGTIRLLKNLVLEPEWQSLKMTIRQVTAGHKKVTAIGSGGNINKVYSSLGQKDGKPLLIDQLRKYHAMISKLSVEERMVKLHLKRDRADVIEPALQIYLNVMKWAGAEEIYVPKIGLADGLIHHIYDEIQSTKNKK